MMHAKDTLQWWLDNCQVSHIGENDPADWWHESLPYAVFHPTRGVVGLFTNQRDALHYRLSMINDALNPPTIAGVL